MFLSNSVFKSFTSFKCRDFHSWDFDLLAWVSWINTSSSSTFAYAESSETSDCNTVSFFELAGYEVNNSFQRSSSSFFGDSGCSGDGIYHICLGHREWEKEKSTDDVIALPRQNQALFEK
jgi:hypothetical protein